MTQSGVKIRPSPSRVLKTKVLRTGRRKWVPLRDCAVETFTLSLFSKLDGREDCRFSLLPIVTSVKFKGTGSFVGWSKKMSVVDSLSVRTLRMSHINQFYKTWVRSKGYRKSV